MIVLFRPKLDLYSGAGQLLRMQALGLRAAGARVVLACERGALKFFLRSGLSVRRTTVSALSARARGTRDLVVDHGMAIPEAQMVYVHNLAAEAVRHVARDQDEIESERRFFRALAPSAQIVANSNLVKNALAAHFRIAAERVAVQCPGFQAGRFSADRAAGLRRRARAELRIADAVPLIGFVTSGDLAKRGLDVFLATAERIAAALPAARFLVVGARHLPEFAQRHELVVGGRLLYRSKNRQPEKWLAALDLFLYAARFEEFGMVVLEAQALGVPVLTSRRVGAAECLPPAYADWIVDEPDPDALATRAVRLSTEPAIRVTLAAAGLERVREFTDERYAESTAAAILRSAGSDRR